MGSIHTVLDILNLCLAFLILQQVFLFQMRLNSYLDFLAHRVGLSF